VLVELPRRSDLDDVEKASVKKVEEPGTCGLADRGGEQIRSAFDSGEGQAPGIWRGVGVVSRSLGRVS
jgi:hypothetical protein